MKNKFGWYPPKRLKEEAPEGANLYVDFSDDDFVHDIVYFKTGKNGSLFHYHDGFKSWMSCTNPTQDLLSRLKPLEDDGLGSTSYKIGDKVVIVEKEAHPQIWTVIHYHANGKFELICDGPFLSGVTMPFDKEEFRKATPEELQSNTRI